MQHPASRSKGFLGVSACALLSAACATSATGRKQLILMPEDELNTMGDQMLGMVTAHDYSAAHDSALNKKYVEEFKKANNFRPNFVSVGGYDGMHLIYEALKKTGGKTDGDTLLAAMKGMRWESPRGMMSIDPDTRDIVQPIYIRKVEKLNGELWNTEFAKFDDVKDPLKMKK